ncbi:MAG TPA: (2Fe-2S) ferredoxin domain-containing protein, partial [Methylomirabilota bacterium]|nr:(2Fe-2S) ferredoxin domain-containing protein [Methylomirabilota bacterium]
MYERRRNIVVRRDGRRVNVARFRGQLFVCATGCCCGRTEDGFAPVPTETFHREWERRRLRNVIHLTIGGCLGPCALANVVLLLFDGQTQWFHSIDSEAQALALYDHVERMLEADGCLPPPAGLAPYHFTASASQPRPDGQPVDDARLWRAARGHACEAPASGVTADGRALS